MIPRRAVNCPLITIFAARRESFRRPYCRKLFMLPPQGLRGYPKVPLSVCCSWNRLVKEEVSSNRGIDIAVWDVLRIIRCPRYRISFPREILPLNNPDEFLCHLGFLVSLLFDVLAVRDRVQVRDR